MAHKKCRCLVDESYNSGIDTLKCDSWWEEQSNTIRKNVGKKDAGQNPYCSIYRLVI